MSRQGGLACKRCSPLDPHVAHSVALSSQLRVNLAAAGVDVCLAAVDALLNECLDFLDRGAVVEHGGLL